MDVNGYDHTNKTKNLITNISAIAVGYGAYSISDEIMKKKMEKLYFNKSIIGKFSITCVEAFIGICTWDYAKEKISKIL